MRELARRVKLEVDDRVHAMFPQKRAVRVAVRLKSSAVYEERLEDAKGSEADTMTRGEVGDTFRDLASLALPCSRVDEIIRVVESLEDLNSVSADEMIHVLSVRYEANRELLFASWRVAELRGKRQEVWLSVGYTHTLSLLSQPIEAGRIVHVYQEPGGTHLTR